MDFGAQPHHNRMTRDNDITIATIGYERSEE
jgi:hypothetical protein